MHIRYNAIKIVKTLVYHIYDTTTTRYPEQFYNLKYLKNRR